MVSNTRQCGKSALYHFTIIFSCLSQVWNMNQVNGLLFAANVQGASWDRSRRCLVTHDAAPPPLQASDNHVAPLHGCLTLQMCIAMLPTCWPIS